MLKNPCSKSTWWIALGLCALMPGVGMFVSIVLTRIAPPTAPAAPAALHANSSHIP